MNVEQNKKSNEAKRYRLEEQLDNLRLRISKNNYTIKNFLGWLLLVSSVSSLLYWFGLRTSDRIETEDVTVIAIVSIISAFLGFFIFPYYNKSLLRLQEAVIKGRLAEIGSEELQDEIQEDFFTNLVKINFKYIDKYYLQTQIQADKSFSVSVVCSVIAFLIIISGIVLMYFNKTTSAYIATVSGLLSEFVAAVFFYLYNRTITKMGEYHHKLVLTQNISLALKITEQMPANEKAISQMKLIEELTKNINQFIASKPD